MKKPRMAASAKPKQSQALHYRIAPIDCTAHLFEVQLTIAAHAPEGHVLSLPNWIPGSYMVREFAKNIVTIGAHVKTTAGKRRAIGIEKIDKHAWRVAPNTAPVTVTYRVYAWDLSVRCAHLDALHGFFNGAGVFLQVAGLESTEHVVDIVAPDEEFGSSWRVATTLPELGAKRYGFGTYVAADYDALIDHPVEMGTFLLARFEACGVPHEIAFTGSIPHLDAERICEDLKAICETQIRLFEPSKARAPFTRYLFLAMVLTDGYGGLEHRSSTALLCARNSLPVTDKPEQTDAYRKFLGLCSHEYFHSWNVKRIKPAAFAPYDLTRESYTGQLWFFEGVTSYYDDLLLLRAKVITPGQYLELIANTINSVMGAPGRLIQSLADSSFDAWIKYYRPDENTPNAVVSYYQKGSLVGLVLDLHLRAATAGKRSLDDVMRLLWKRYGKDFYEGGGLGVPENAFAALVEEATGVAVATELRQWVDGVAELPLEALLASVGIEFIAPRVAARVSAGWRTKSVGSECRLSAVLTGSPAHRAGLSAGDTLVALDGLRVSAGTLETLLERYHVGDRVTIHAFRRDELLRLTLKLSGDRKTTDGLAMTARDNALRRAWLR